MLFPIIRVKDRETGHDHIVGTNSHDSLILDGGKGQILYYNLQNGDGSYGGGYSFVPGEDDEFGPRIEFVTFEELSKIYEEEKVNAAIRREELERNIARIMEKYK